MKKVFVIVASALMLAACTEKAPELTKSGLDPRNFDAEYEGQSTCLVTLTNGSGMEVCVTNFGGRIVSIMVPDRNGEYRDVVLGFDRVSDYFPENNKTDFGASIGRYANRIGDGKFSIDGKEYQLPLNDNGVCCLHGGFSGWQYKVYSVAEADDSHVKLTVVSPDGDNNFPGTVTASVTFTLTEDNRIDISYEAETDAPTVINMTNHSYFNLSGDPACHTVCDDFMTINADSFTPTDEHLIPTGEFASVEGTPLDFRGEARRIGDRIETVDFQPIAFGHGYDHNWVLNHNCPDVPDASVTCPATGIVLDVYTDEPGIQVYTGNFLDGSVTGKKGVVYNRRTAICLESQHYPDSPNKAEWPTTVLRPGEKYSSHCVFAFGVTE